MKIKNLKLKIIFLGSSKFVIPILDVLRKNFDLSLVLTTENKKGSVVEYCIENKIPYLSVQQFNNITIKQLQELNSPVAVLADFGLIIPKEILNIFPKGIINIHPSLLPKYRGPTPVQTAILNGEKITGVTIIKLDEKIDHGPILRQTKEQILENDTSESLYERLFLLGASSIVQTIELYLRGGIKLQEQDHRQATFTKILKRENGFIDISSPLSKETLDRMTRAYFPWPGVWLKTKLKGTEKIIKLLPEKKIQVEGKRPMSYKDFVNGYSEVKEILAKLKGIN